MRRNFFPPACGILLSIAAAAQNAEARGLAEGHDRWYALRKEGAPWGYVHEVIQATKAGVNCRVEITRMEGKSEYTETLSAMAENNDALTPKYFSLRKFDSGSRAAETIDGNNDPKTGMHVTVTGARRFAQAPLRLKDGVILECYLPAWMKIHWNDLKPGGKKTVSVFAESISSPNYAPVPASLSVPLEQKRKCRTVRMIFQDVESAWCVNEDGSYEDMLIVKPETRIESVAGEREAREFLSKAK